MNNSTQLVLKTPIGIKQYCWAASSMRVRHQFLLALAFLLMLGTGCASRTPHQIAEDSLTEHFAREYIHPLSDPVAALAHRGASLPPELLASNRVTCVEIKPKKGDPQIVFEDETRRPPNDGMITGVDHARNVGLYYPASLDQPEIEVRMNYSCDIGDFVAVHIVVPNPLLLPKRK
jgi:hypothetical protein